MFALLPAFSLSSRTLLHHKQTNCQTVFSSLSSIVSPANAGSSTNHCSNSSKLSAHKSLDTVDRILQQLDSNSNYCSPFTSSSSSSASKLPKFFTTMQQQQQQPSTSKGVATTPTASTASTAAANENDDEPSLSGGTLSRSSTASLGPINTLNEILAAAESDVLAYDDDDDDYHEPAELGLCRLAAIDESLSPLPSVLVPLDHIDDISLNSVEFEDVEREVTISAESVKPPPQEDDASRKEEQLIEEEIVKAVEVEVEGAATKPVVKQNLASLRSKNLRVPTAAAAASNPNRRTFTKLPQERPGPSGAATGKSLYPGRMVSGGSGATNNSSKGSSVNVSRTSTPALSESDFGATELNSLGSAHSACKFLSLCLLYLFFVSNDKLFLSFLLQHPCTRQLSPS